MSGESILNSNNQTFNNITLTDATNQITIGSGTTITINASTPGSDTTLNLPTVSDTLVGRATSDTFTGTKTFTGGFNIDGGGTGPFININTTNSGTYSIIPPNTSSIRVLTLPDTTDTVVCQATSDILTNKTLTSPAMSNATFTSAISGYTPTAFSYYEEYATSYQTTGPFAPNYIACYYVRFGRVVILQWADLAGTTVSASVVNFTITESRLLPNTNQNYIVWGRDNGAYTSLVVAIATTGIVTVGVGDLDNAFTNGALGALWGSTITYRTA